MVQINRREAIGATLELIVGASLGGCTSSGEKPLRNLRKEILDMGYEVAELHEVQNPSDFIVLYGDLHTLFQRQAIELFNHLQAQGISLVCNEGYSGKYNGQDYRFEREVIRQGKAQIFGIDNDELFSLADDFSEYNILRLQNLGKAPTADQEALEKRIMEKIREYDGRQIGVLELREKYIELDNKYARDERSFMSAKETLRVMRETSKNKAFMIYGSNHVDELVPELNKLGISVLLVMYKNIKLRYK
ncbi:MAG: hypothetical protein AABX25_02905 [Nanoarchaeota archaeon]